MSPPRLGYGRVSSHPHEPDPLGFVRSYRTGFVLGIRTPWWFGQYAPTTAPDTRQTLRGNNTYATGSQHETKPPSPSSGPKPPPRSPKPWDNYNNEPQTQGTSTYPNLSEWTVRLVLLQRYQCVPLKFPWALPPWTRENLITTKPLCLPQCQCCTLCFLRGLRGHR